MKDRLINFLGAGKKRRGIVVLCVLVVIFLIVIVLVAWNIQGSGPVTVEQALNLNFNEVDQIDISNGDRPQTKIKNKADIQNLLDPFIKIKMNEVSKLQTSIMKHSLQNRSGAFGLYYVMYKSGSPYMHMQFFEPNLIIVRTNGQPNDMIFYRTADSLDTDLINHLIDQEMN